MPTYRRLERAVGALFIAYALAAVYQQLVLGGGDSDRLFPVASWSLFAQVPSEITDYSVRVLELNGEQLAAPNFVENAGPSLRALATVDAYQLIQKLGRALRRGDPESVAHARRALEGICLNGAESFRYEVVRRTYDPMERWHSGTVRAAQTLGQFDSRAQP